MNNKPFSRAERVEKQLLKVVNELILHEIDIRKLGFITFSTVKVTSDLKHANIFFSVINPSRTVESIAKNLNELVPLFRKSLSRTIKLKTVPTLKFFYDDSFEQFQKINELMKKI